MEQNWFILYNGQQVGPMSKEQLLHYGLNPNSKVWCDGMSAWSDAYTVPELMALLPVNSGAANAGGYAPYNGTQSTPNSGGYAPYTGGNSTPNYNQMAMQQYGVEPKSKVTAGVLAILIGTLGIQYFYCGKIAGGFICILLSLISCGLWNIVNLIQGIMMLSMSDEEFNEKYVFTTKTFPLF